AGRVRARERRRLPRVFRARRRDRLARARAGRQALPRHPDLPLRDDLSRAEPHVDGAAGHSGGGHPARATARSRHARAQGARGGRHEGERGAGELDRLVERDPAQLPLHAAPAAGPDERAGPGEVHVPEQPLGVFARHTQQEPVRQERPRLQLGLHPGRESARARGPPARRPEGLGPRCDRRSDRRGNDAHRHARDTRSRAAPVLDGVGRHRRNAADAPRPVRPRREGRGGACRALPRAPALGADAMSPSAPAVHLVDATYELFRAYFPLPPAKAPDGREVGATRGILSTLLYLVQQEGATHVACATDHVIRSFRNELYAGYKTEEGVEPALLAQFPLVEEAMRALGLVVWPMVEFEADDALPAGGPRLPP